MADLTKLVFIEAGLQEIEVGTLSRHVEHLAEQVVQQARVNASGRPGPRIRTGDMFRAVDKQPSADVPGAWEVGSNADHRGYQYPSALETGLYLLRNNARGPRYPWLVPALESVMSRT